MDRPFEVGQNLSLGHVDSFCISQHFMVEWGMEISGWTWGLHRMKSCHYSLLGATSSGYTHETANKG